MRPRPPTRRAAALTHGAPQSCPTPHSSLLRSSRTITDMRCRGRRDTGLRQLLTEETDFILHPLPRTRGILHAYEPERAINPRDVRHSRHPGDAGFRSNRGARGRTRVDSPRDWVRLG